MEQEKTPLSCRALDDIAIAEQAATQVERGAAFRKFVAEKYTGEFEKAAEKPGVEAVRECTCSPLRRFVRDAVNTPFFYLGALLPFTFFGLIVATILFTEWLWRLV